MMVYKAVKSVVDNKGSITFDEEGAMQVSSGVPHG